MFFFFFLRNMETYTCYPFISGALDCGKHGDAQAGHELSSLLASFGQLSISQSQKCI